MGVFVFTLLNLFITFKVLDKFDPAEIALLLDL